MPVHENARVAGETTGLDNDTPRHGGVDASRGVVLKASGTPSTQQAPIGTKPDLAPPTGLTPTDAGTGGAISVAYTEDAAGTTVDIIVFEGEDDAAGTFVDIFEDAATPLAISGLTDGTVYTVYARTVASDGRYGPWSAGAEVTPTTT